MGGLTSVAVANLVRGVPYMFTHGEGLPDDPAVLWAK